MLTSEDRNDILAENLCMSSLFYAYIFLLTFFVCFDVRVVLSCSTPLSRWTIFTEALPIKPDDSSVFNIKAIVYSRVSRFGLAVRRYGDKRKVRYRFGSPFSSERL